MTDAYDRLVRAPLFDERLTHIIRDGMVVTDGLPDSSRLINIYRNNARDMFELIFASPDFGVVLEAEKIPEIEVRRNVPKGGIRFGCNPRKGGGRNPSRLEMSYDIFGELFTNGRTLRHELPDDTRGGSMWVDETRRTVNIELYSAEFDYHEAGQEIQVLSDDVIDIECVDGPKTGTLTAYFEQR